jgi:microcystin-dependent protein
MSTPYVGEIRLVAFNFAPENWALCNGATLSISQNEVLFALLGTTFGGDGVNTFRVPDLQGRIALHQGSTFVMGQSGGAESVTLTTAQLPSHTHTIGAQVAAGTAQSPAGGVFAASSAPQYGTGAGSVSGQALQSAGSGQPHENRMPYLTCNYIISLFGIFPSRS